MGAVSFEDCVEACDTTPTCIDVSYVAPACYLKSSLTILQDAAWVSTAVFVGRAVDPMLAIPLSCIDMIDPEKRFLTLTIASDFETRCRLFNKTLRKGHESQRLPALPQWANEEFPLYSSTGEHVLNLDGCGVGMFGIINYSVISPPGSCRQRESNFGSRVEPPPR